MRKNRCVEAEMKHKKAKDTKVAIVGAGLVGSLCASFLAKRGYDVCLYEYREDIRKTELLKGRSINLALSERGRMALREIGLENLIIREHGIPMKGRMIHNINGTKYSIPYDRVNNQCIYSVNRKYLNEVLLTEAEKHPKVKIMFKRKLVDLNLQEGSMMFLCTDSKEMVNAEADLIIGADGAHSCVRKKIMKQPLYNCTQQYIEHGYLELSIPSTSSGDFAMEPNYLHIWPRGSFMMIALPNQDKTWTVTLFMPFTEFGKLTNEEELLQFFDIHFPDALLLMTKKRLARDFFDVEPAALISIKCNPYHYQNKVLIIGDAAHAMVPFYGQGMNAGFEDCLLLNQCLMKYCGRLDSVLPEFSKVRNPDAEAICDLAMYNYIEMRDLVNKTSYHLRKKLDDFLYRIFPKFWLPLYNSVTFTDVKYSQCIKNKRNQDKIVMVVLIVIAAEIFFFLYSFWNMFVKSG